MQLLELILLLTFVSLCARADETATLRYSSLRCRAFAEDNPVTLDVPKFKNWCAKKIDNADGSVVMADGKCSSAADWAEKCCMQMFREQINFPKTSAAPEWDKGWYGNPRSRVGDKICARISKRGVGRTKHSLVLLFQYKCAPYISNEYNQQPGWLNDYESIAVSQDILRKEGMDVSICCKDGLFYDYC